MRFSCDVYIEIDMVRSVENKIPFYISGNKVILSPGLNGILPIEYFSLVKSVDNSILYSQKYDLIVYFIFKEKDLLKELNLIIIVDSINKNILKEFKLDDTQNNHISELEVLNNICEYIITKNLFREKIVIAVDNKNIEIFENIIYKNIGELKCKSFFTYYLPLENYLTKNEKWEYENMLHYL